MIQDIHLLYFTLGETPKIQNRLFPDKKFHPDIELWCVNQSNSPMITNDRINQKNTLDAVRRIFDDPTINFGKRGDFEMNGKKIIVRAGDRSTKIDMNYRSAFRGYDYTLNIRFEKDGLCANPVAH